MVYKGSVKAYIKILVLHPLPKSKLLLITLGHANKLK